MSDVTKLTDHPKYPGFKTPDPPDEYDPMREHKAYMEYLGEMETVQTVGDVEFAPQKTEPPSGLTVCLDCYHFLDRRPFWKRWLLVPRPDDAHRLRCKAKRCQEGFHPVTGEAFGGDYDFCQEVNRTGRCNLFQPRTR
jgi:hypothetical protein